MELPQAEVDGREKKKGRVGGREKETERKIWNPPPLEPSEFYHITNSIRLHWTVEINSEVLDDPD